MMTENKTNYTPFIAINQYGKCEDIYVDFSCIFGSVSTTAKISSPTLTLPSEITAQLVPKHGIGPSIFNNDGSLTILYL